MRADIRQRWRALVGLALLLGLVGGVALTAAAGARRTDTAYPRLLQWANAAQVDVIPQGTGLGGYYGALARLPQVSQLTTVVLYQAALPGSRNLPVNLLASPDGGLGTRVSRVKVVRGAMFDPATPGVAVVDQQMAAAEHLAPGDAVRVLGVPNDPKTNTPDFGKATLLAFRVTGIVVFDNQVVATASVSAEPTVLVSAPSAAAVKAAADGYGDEAAVRLRPGASMSQFLAGASALAVRYRHGTVGQVDAVSMADQVSATERAIRPQATALAVFAALTGLIALAVISQLLARQLTMDSGEFPVLRAIGVTRSALVALSLARLAMVTICGAGLAVVAAVTASPLMPIGPARLAEPHPGLDVDPAILGAGVAIIALLPLAVLARAAWRTASVTRAPRQPRGAGSRGGPPGGADAAAPQRPSRLAGSLGRAGSVSGGIGVQMALEPGRGRTAVPVRSALAGTTVAVAALVAAMVFGTSLAGLVSTPRAYGQNWQERLDLGFGGATAQVAAGILRSYPSVTGYAAGDYGLMSVNGTPVAAIGVDELHGSGYLTLLAGRAPAAPGEIALGARTMATAHARLGQDVRVVITRVAQAGPPAAATMRVVGEAVFPAFSRGSFAPTDLGTGAVVTAAALSEPSPDTGCGAPDTCYNFFLLRFRPGTDLAAAAARLTATLTAAGCPVGSCATSPDQRPGDIRDYAGVRDTPLGLGAVLAVLAIGTLAHVLLTSVRRRARDLAMLKTLGFTRAQVLRAVAWQATALAAAALLIGVPLGVVAGRWAWTLFADSVGVPAQPDVPMALIAAAIAATLLVANLIAAGPGWRAARVRPATVLRSE